MAMLDLSKAFDCVQHDKLLLELYACGIGGKALAWLCSYLSSRQQQVVCRRNPPGRTVSCQPWCPSGFCTWSASVRPVVLYIRSLPTCLAFSTSQLYADDTNVYVADKTADAAIKKLEKDLHSVSEFLHSRELKLKAT